MLRPVILEAAMRLFSERGSERPTMDQVAATAGVQKPTLYAYFDGKSALVEAVIEMSLQALPAPRPVDEALPLRQQFIDAGHQLQTLAVHPANTSLFTLLSEHRLSVKQLAGWRRTHEAFADVISGMLARHCDCDYPGQAAQLFLLLVAGHLRPDLATAYFIDPTRIESAVDWLLRAYPQRDAPGR